MMGPLAGIGDPVFWFTIRPILGALGASLAQAGNIAGPLIFFIGWNLIRMAFLWYTQELGYKAGSEITKDISGGILKDITKGASILGMFILAVLVERWVSIVFTVNLPGKVLSKGAYIEWPKGNVSGDQLKTILGQVNDKLSFDKIQVDTLQKQLDSLIPGLTGLLLTFACMWLLKKKVSPITIIIALFVACCFWFLYNKTRHGKYMYAIGGNEAAAEVAGVNVYATKIRIYILASCMFGLAGCLLAAKSGGASVNTAQGYELDAIAACTIGGVSTTGGVGTVPGVLVGVLVFELMKVALQFMNVNSSYTYIVQGLVIIVAVAIDIRKYLAKK